MSIPEVFPRTPATEAPRGFDPEGVPWYDDGVTIGPRWALWDFEGQKWDAFPRGYDPEAEARAPLLALLDVAARWETFYGEIDTDGTERWMTQLDHGHEEYEVRIELMAALRAALEEPTK